LRGRRLPRSGRPLPSRAADRPGEHDIPRDDRGVAPPPVPGERSRHRSRFLPGVFSGAHRPGEPNLQGQGHSKGRRRHHARRAMPTHVRRLVSESLNEAGRAVKGSRVLVLGVAYKRGIGDTRESPAYEIVATLRGKGAHVSYADPYVPTFRIDDGTELKAVE